MRPAPRRIRFHADFRDDLRSQLAWLRDHRDRSWVERLRMALDEATSLLAHLPDMGTIETSDGDVVIRRLVLGKLPYVVWYLRDSSAPNSDVWLLRLFHARQDRPLPVAPPAARR